MNQYEPYQNLLFAIFNSDEFCENYDKRKAIIIAYDIKNYYLPIGVFNGNESAAVFFNTTREVISCSISRNTIKYGRIVLERLTE